MAIPSLVVKDRTPRAESTFVSSFFVLRSEWISLSIFDRVRRFAVSKPGWAMAAVPITFAVFIPEGRMAAIGIKER